MSYEDGCRMHLELIAIEDQCDRILHQMLSEFTRASDVVERLLGQAKKLRKHVQKMLDVATLDISARVEPGK
jgi:outer membrane PBP1 activator LpoA protein